MTYRDSEADIVPQISAPIVARYATLLREARMASAIEHPNVCAIYAIGETAEDAYIVMQYVPGRALSQLIAQGQVSIQISLSVGIPGCDSSTRTT